MSENFTPLLPTLDWNEEWKKLQKARRRVDDSSYWDQRSSSFTTKDSPNDYVDSFLRLAQIKPGETVFDMGCGTGALSIPLGAQGHQVIAADFSRGMLDIMEEELKERSIDTVTPKLMSWQDDWLAYGMEDNGVDVALASRSIATDDMKNALLRLNAVAKRRVCITLTTGSSPRMDERVMQAIGIKGPFGRDFQYALNILINEGMKPELSYIESLRYESYENTEDAFQDYQRMVNDVARGFDEREIQEVLGKLGTWLGEHLIKNPHVGEPDKKGLPQKAYCLDRPRKNTWAFIAWNVQRGQSPMHISP